MSACICPKECDCQNPPPSDGPRRGVHHVSNECPVHNFYPYPNRECPVHGNMAVLDFLHLRVKESEGNHRRT